MEESEAYTLAGATAEAPFTAKTLSVALNSTNDWDDWIYLIKGAATKGNLWKYVNPDVAQPEAFPGPPEEPIRPPGLLTAEQQQTWATDNMVYNRQFKTYETLCNLMNNLDSLVNSSISPNYLPYFQGLETDTVYHKLKCLKSAVAPSDRGRELSVTAHYEVLKKLQSRLTVETWLNRFRRAYTQAKLLQLPCVDKDRGATDFLNAVKYWEPAWAEAKLATLLDEAPEKASTVDELIDSFTRRHSLNRGEKTLANAKSGRPNIVFAGASLNGRRDATAPGPCVCKDVHWYSDCPYLNENKRPSDWSADEAIQTDIDAQLQDKALRERIQNSIRRSNRIEASKSSISSNSSKRTNKSFKQKKKDHQNRPGKDGNQGGSSSNTNNLGGGSDLLNFVNAAAYSASSIGALRQQWILDSGSDIHVTNDRSSLTNIRSEKRGKLVAGATKYSIEATGTASIQVMTKLGPATMTLPDVAYLPRFMTNIVSLSLLMQKDVHWNTKTGYLTRNDHPIAVVNRFNGHWTLSSGSASQAKLSNVVDDEDEDEYEGVESLFKALSIEGCVCRDDSASFAVERSLIDSNLSVLWHARLGHPGVGALSHLSSSTNGVPRFVLDKTICETCMLSKATEIVSRTAERETPEEHPFHRVSCDLIQLEPGFNSSVWIVHFQCFQTGFSLLFCEPRKGGFMRIFQLFLFHVKTQYKQDVRIIRIDGEGSMSKEVVEYLRRKGIAVETTVSYTPAQNGHAERTGRTLLTKARALRLNSRLPHDLWPEIVRTAVYLMNRTPRQKLGWKTPFEALFGRKPSLKHLHIVGSKCYFLDHRVAKTMKLDPRAEIGYLVGYDSTNIWRIWNPANGYTIIRARDVYFNEGQMYDPSDLGSLQPVETLQRATGTVNLDLFNLSANAHPNADEADPEDNDPDGFHDTIEVRRPTPQSSQLGNSAGDQSGASHASLYNVQTNELGNIAERSALLHTSTPTSMMTPQSFNSPISTPQTGPTTVSPGPAGSPSPGRVTNDEDTLSWTGNTAPRAQQISATPHSSLILPEGSKRKKRRLAQFTAQDDEEESLAHCYMAFTESLTASTRVNYRQSPQASVDLNILRIHRDRLPPEPKGWKDLSRHPFKQQFIDASHTEYAALLKRGTFREVDRQRHHSPLPLLWIFKYKFDTDGYLVKFKARACVRGDLQTSYTDNYAATLAVKVFRALMAIAAAFDLEIIQLDVVNAFLNSDIDEDITVQWPPGFQGSNHRVLKLLKALYGLKQAPLLWHNHLVALLTKLGLRRASGVNCVLVSDWIIVFFYVDDIMLLFPQEHRPKVEQFLTQLKAQVDLRQMDEANWFLGIRIIRDRNTRRLWLCQDSYIDKVCARFNIGEKTKGLAFTPLVADHLDPYDGEATVAERQGYQSRVGSINFAAVVTRPDIAKACSILSQHLHNPGPLHLRAADRVIAYLQRTKFLAIEYCGLIDQSEFKVYPAKWIEAYPFECYSDAAFADNIDRKSSDGYLFLLYGGAIDWKASKQSTVTTSSTEAELLALSRTAKELIAWRRFFNEISFSIDGGIKLIQSDNTQTIRLLTREEPLLTTKLRHVDIHQHWLRQEVQEGNIDVDWTSTTTMKADGLTKPLPRQPFERFIRQLHLVDIQTEIEQQQQSGRVC